MWAYFVVLADPGIEIGLQLIDGTIHLLAERDTIEFVQHGLVEALTDAVGLRALGPGARVIDVLDPITRSLSRSAAVIGVLRSYSLVHTTLL